MNNHRRNVLRLTSVIALMASTGLITNAQAAEWNKAAFDGKNLDDVHHARTRYCRKRRCCASGC